MERELEPERVVVVDHPAAPVGEHPALGGPAAERADHLLDVQTGLDGEDDPLRDPDVGPGQDHLVDGLDRLPGTDRTDVGDRPAHRREDGPGVLDVGRIAADEDRQGRVAGTFAPTRHRRVDHPEAALGQARREVPAAGRGDGRAVDDERSGGCAVDDAALPEQDGLDVGRVRDADDGDVDPGHRSGRAVGERHAEIGQLRGPARRPVPADDLEPGTGQVAGHRRTHRAESEEGDPAPDRRWLRRHGCGRRVARRFLGSVASVALGRSRSPRRSRPRPLRPLPLLRHPRRPGHVRAR